MARRILASPVTWTLLATPVILWAALSAGTAVAVEVVGLAGSVVLATIVPFRVLTGFVAVISALTLLWVPIGEANVRIDMLCVPALLLAALIQGEFHRLVRWLFKPPFILLIGWLVLSAIASVTRSLDVEASLFFVLAMASNLLVCVSVLTAYESRRDDLERVLLASSVVLALSAVVAWLVALVTGQDNWGANSAAGFGLRAHGLAYEPNIMAATAGFWILVILTGKKITRARWWALLLFALVLPLTSTRSALLGLAVGLLIVMLSRPKVLARVVPLGFFAGITFAVVALALPKVVEPILEKLTEWSLADQTVTYRENAWQMALSDLGTFDGWAFGLGSNSFQQRHLDPTLIDSGVGYNLSNLPLQVLHDTGVIGVLLVGAAALTLLGGGSVARRLALLAYFLVISIAVAPLLLATWWLPIALAKADRDSDGAEPAPAEPSRAARTPARRARV